MTLTAPTAAVDGTIYVPVEGGEPIPLLAEEDLEACSPRTYMARPFSG